jgi:hypothetical protein
MFETHRATIRRDVLISIAISVLMNTLMHVVIFGKSVEIPAWSIGGAVLDTAPTAFMTGFMSSLMPGLAAQKRVRNGLPRRLGANARRIPGNVLARAAILAVGGSVCMTIFGAILAYTTSADAFNFYALLGWKIGLSILLPITITPLAVNEALSDA